MMVAAECYKLQFVIAGNKILPTTWMVGGFIKLGWLLCEDSLVFFAFLLHSNTLCMSHHPSYDIVCTDLEGQRRY